MSTERFLTEVSYVEKKVDDVLSVKAKRIEELENEILELKTK